MGCLFYPRKQTSVSYAADCDVIACYGGAKLVDKRLAATVHCVDDEILGWLKRRDQRCVSVIGLLIFTSVNANLLPCKTGWPHKVVGSRNAIRRGTGHY
jgi:hypothetical protein